MGSILGKAILHSHERLTPESERIFEQEDILGTEVPKSTASKLIWQGLVGKS